MVNSGRASSPSSTVRRILSPPATGIFVSPSPSSLCRSSSFADLSSVRNPSSQELKGFDLTKRKEKKGVSLKRFSNHK
ncbi:hypothetical protein LOK49_LG11G01993 [Camellia lanceoleosa]|uniref:Uncharacterized protein n=1 Tax=Camellia lanceoleosa TaxID=1840588 RepID=A0ACC0G4V1_9ERIC|nr:hypothetical protein LOK49_LG11G01993 [Camellia lanceoleosa]